jgi:hypothetical protein
MVAQRGVARPQLKFVPPPTDDRHVPAGAVGTVFAVPASDSRAAAAAVPRAISGAGPARTAGAASAQRYELTFCCVLYVYLVYL